MRTSVLIAVLATFILILIPVNRVSAGTTRLHNLQNDTVIVDDTANSGENNIIIFSPNNNPWISSVSFSGKSYSLVNLLILAILFSIATMITLLVIILLNRRRMEKEAKLRQYLLETYQGLILDYLFGEPDISRFRKIASDRFRRGILIDQMIDVAVNLSGGTEKKLDALYYELGLNHDSLKRAYSRRWHIKIKGFRELAFMNITDANDELYRSLNSRNEILRMEAQIALTRLSTDNPFDFLNRLKQPFSIWEQISLHELMIQHQVKVPSFSQFLGSPNDSVVLFSLRMIREFRQLDAEEELLKTMTHPQAEVRFLAYQVAGDLELESSLEIMKGRYKYEDYRNGLEIVRSIGKMPRKRMLGFLKLILDKEEDIQLQIEATKAIERVGEEGVAALEKLMKSEYKNYSIIIRHVLDKRIN